MTEPTMRRELRWIHLDDDARPEGELPLLDAPFPAREETSITELMSSVRLHGVLSPILVRIVDGQYQVVCGHRRLRAARKAGLSKIPAFIMELEDAAAIRCYLSTRALRKPLGADEQNRILQTLKDLRDGKDSSTKVEGSPAPSRAQRLSLQGRGIPTAAEGPGGPRMSPSSRPRRRIIGARESLRGRVFVAESDGNRLAAELLTRAEALFETIQKNRAISVERTEALIDDLLLLLEGGAPVDLRLLVTETTQDFAPPHALLTAALCAHVARGLGWSRESFRSFVAAGLLHDVGMVFVRTSFLAQPRALTEDERNELECHTRIGCALISGTHAWDDQVAICARDHHERWDGNGYPSGHKGSRVAFPARLMGLLDTYAALLTPRPHRDALQPHRARERLRKALELGLFDPSFLFLLDRTLSVAPVKGLQSVGGYVPETAEFPEVPAPEVPGGNSVELEEEVATILSTNSEQYT